MIPVLRPIDQLPPNYRRFLTRLAESGFRGDIQTDYATRLVTATDNSVYQLVPVGVVFPRDTADVRVILRMLAEPEFAQITLSPRGGGTGTNGQSLSDGLILDISRYMSSILEINLAERWARVQPGVVLDQLNAALAGSGLFFAPNLSPSNRATIGGMVSTDASGKGSRVYGKTSEHVLGLETVVMGGEVLHTERRSEVDARSAAAGEGDLARIHREVFAVLDRSEAKIRQELPALKRFLTGYDLAHVRDERGTFDLGRILSGSEGTLGVLTEAKVLLTPLPKAKQLVAIRYSEFDAALRAAQQLVALKPGAIETIDSMIVSLAQKDVIWHSVAHLLDATGEPPLAAVNLVEFEGDDLSIVSARMAELTALLDGELGQPGRASGYKVATEKADIAALWSLRKKGVGLLGNASGLRRPVPFVEDTVVPPESLADYIQEFRALLDQHGLRYGMFGHVDVGCLHVRPALNLRDPEDEKKLLAISDEVVRLTKKYGGVLWGEHGRGYRSQYTPTFFGPELYAEMRAVKAAFDPRNQLNPGKLAVPRGLDDKLVSISGPTRGSFDREIHPEALAHYETSVNCNGNGACFNWDPDAVMCPSSKVTRDRMHSPKGRAGLLREWLRLTTREGYNAGRPAVPGRKLPLFGARPAPQEDFSHEVYEAMNGCLACKACATDCPIKVDVPHLRSEFLDHYHTRYRRPLKDFFVASLETVLRVLVLWPRLSNAAMALGRGVLEWIGIVDSPRLASQTLDAGLRVRGAKAHSVRALESLSAAERAQGVVLLQDAFTRFYEPGVFLAAYDLIRATGQTPYVLDYFENGKGLHIKGFLRWFRATASRAAERLGRAQALGMPLVGVEPAVTLTYRDEYKKLELPEMAAVKVELLQEYLARHTDLLSKLRKDGVPSAAFRLFGHCTERTLTPKSQAEWKRVFEAAGFQLDAEATGCCGMCGVFGHEAEHRQESEGVFAMSWAKKLPSGSGEQARVVATGHSCRSQVKRFGGFVPLHPAEALVQTLRLGQ